MCCSDLKKELRANKEEEFRWDEEGWSLEETGREDDHAHAENGYHPMAEHR